ncbi:CPBP family intramembrane glutamic endopeptidase [Mesoterricola silvestris]|uniref:CPBP family intramembrane glutamic endopeptidase n=1 Tax=Mesoterricola silvestris TaxID=2927979 RepID=UPI0029310C6F|nr:CPBP family intramembrane glutamic endopeptidase [Mesoterricola silvestris]
MLFYLATAGAYRLVLGLAPAVPPSVGLCATLLAVSALFLALEDRSLPSLGLRPGAAWARDFALGAAGGCGIILLSALLAYAAGGFHLVRGAGAGALAPGAAFYFLPAFSEELAFRGYLFQRVEWGLGTLGALLLLSVLFSIAHFSNPGMAGPTAVFAAVNIFLAGVVLGLAYLGTRSLALPFGLHLGWNWCQGSLLGFGVSGTEAVGCFAPVPHARAAWLTGGAFGLEGGLACTLVCLLACYILRRHCPVRDPKSPFSKQ